MKGRRAMERVGAREIEIVAEGGFQWGLITWKLLWSSSSSSSSSSGIGEVQGRSSRARSNPLWGGGWWMMDWSRHTLHLAAHLLARSTS